MAADFAALPATGITPVICGDAHLGNFGFYASPERELVLDLNDFDEAHPGAWEWDLRRLATSIWVAGRHNGASESSCEQAVTGCVKAYRQQLAHLAEEPLLARAYERLDLSRLRVNTTQKSLRKEIKRAAKRAKGRTSDRALPNLTEPHDGSRRIIEDPPLVTRPSGSEYDRVAEALDDYLQTLPPHGAASWAATTSSTSPTRWWGWAPSGYGPTSRCAKAAAPTTSSSCNSSRPAAPSSLATCTATPPGTITRDGVSLNTSRPCRPSATRCWDGPPSARLSRAS